MSVECYLAGIFCDNGGDEPYGPTAAAYSRIYFDTKVAIFYIKMYLRAE